MPLRRSAHAIKHKIEEAQAEQLMQGVPADRVRNQLPGSTLPPGGPSGSGYPPDPDAVTRIDVRKNSAGSVFSRRRLNLIEGTGATLTVADDSGNEEVDITIAVSGGSGTVTSVALTAPSEIGVAGSPITTAGTIALSWATESANRVFAGPTSGGAATPAFRALVSNDIPSLDASKITTGEIPISPLTTRGDLLTQNPSGTHTRMAIGSANRVLRSNGTDPSWAQVDLTTDVTGILPLANGGTGAALIDPNADRILFWDDSAGTVAYLTPGTGLTISGVTMTFDAVNLATGVTGILPAANGGTGVNNTGTITNASNTTITGGGTLALAGNTLTVPATGTAALLATANVFSAAQTMAITDAATAAPATPLTIGHHSSGTPAAAFGTDFAMVMDSATVANQFGLLLRTTWVSATDASRKAKGQLFVFDTTARNAMNVEASGTAAMIGFLGAAAVARPTVSGSRGSNAALASLCTALASLGLITDSSS